MKTSFYFFLWFIIYYLIDLTGNSMLMANDFVIALILVFIVSRIDGRLCAKEKIYQHTLNMQYIYEIFYKGNLKAMLAIVRRELIWQTVWAVYCIITVFGLIAFRSDQIVAYLIFGFFGVLSMIASVRMQKIYHSLKTQGLPPFHLSQYAASSKGFNEYCEKRRAGYSPEALRPVRPPESKAVNIISIVFALACALGGIVYFAVIIFSPTPFNLLMSAMMIWAVLALYFGIKDLIDSIAILRGKPIPSIRPW